MKRHSGRPCLSRLNNSPGSASPLSVQLRRLLSSSPAPGLSTIDQARLGTVTNRVMRSLLIKEINFSGFLASVSEATIDNRPPSNGPHVSATASTNPIGVFWQQTSCPLIPEISRSASRRLTTAEWTAATAFGLPVDPEV